MDYAEVVWGENKDTLAIAAKALTNKETNRQEYNRHIEKIK